MAFLPIFIIGLILGYRLPVWIANFLVWRENQRIISLTTPRVINEARMCATHLWIDVKTIDDNDAVVIRNMCGQCGFFPSTNSMLTIAGLKNILNKKKEAEENKKLMESFVDQDTADIKDFFAEELQGNLDITKVMRVYNAGQTSANRFLLYKQLKVADNKNNEGKL